jgi:hypothetical protein
MSERQAEIHFVRGIAWHDIAKPFYLGRAKHSRTGFLLLAAAGYQEEATYALCHIAGTELRQNLRQYRELMSEVSLPALLLLSNALDRLAASSYSFMQKDFTPPFHAWHNPFTHLPEFHLKLEKPLQAKDHTQGIDKPLRENLVSNAPPQWEKTLENLLEIGGKEDKSLSSDRLEPAPGVNPVALLYEYSCTYPERTYPPVNDTVLSEHTRLSAVFAWVVYRNLEAAGDDILDTTITLNEEGAWLPDGSDAVDFVSLDPKRDPRPFAPGQRLVCAHLDGYLVCITFSGHQQWVEDAARLDDMNGAQVLTVRMRTAFKRVLAAQLGVVELAEFLWISESAFDLVYLLPKALGDTDRLEELIQDSYQAAVDWLVDGQDNPDSLRNLLQEDFRRAQPPLDITAPPTMAELKEQLLSLAYNTQIEWVEPPMDKDDYGTFTTTYGTRLLEAYRRSHESRGFPRTALDSAVASLMKFEKTAAEDVCTICGTHPVYGPLADRMPEDEFLKKVTHTFREEPERPCLACITCRALAHKQVQAEMLHQILSYDPGTGRVRAQPTAGGRLRPPPTMFAVAEVKDPDDFLDMGAAFVRLARKSDALHPLDIFPTVSYAADSMGSVAMLTLSTTNAMFEKYDYRPARDWVAKATSAERASPAWDAFLTDYDAFCEQVANTHSHLLEQVQVVEPHLARVLARQARISRFFDAIAGRLEQEGIRVLALDTLYPTGRWLVPAMQLPDTLKILLKAVAADLLAIPGDALDRPTRRFMELTVPPLLDGTVVVFKQKFPIYLVMETERVLRAELAAEQPFAAEGWYGMHLALADTRGTLTGRAAGKGVVTLDALPGLLALNEQVDRHSVTARVADLGRADPWAQHVADARLFVRSGWWRMNEQERLEAARSLTKEDTFAAVLFLKRTARE